VGFFLQNKICPFLGQGVMEVWLDYMEIEVFTM